MSCVAALLMTTPATALLADDFWEDIIVNDIPDDNSVASIMEEGTPETVGEELKIETDESVETPLYIEDESKEIVEENSYNGEVISDIVEETDNNGIEESVGANTWTVGDGVTANLVTEDGKNTLYFNSIGGTLSRNWLSNIEDPRRKVQM